MSAIVIRTRGLPDGYVPPSVSLDPPSPYQAWRYYGGSADLDRLIDDPTVDIHDLVAEVERLCRREAGASESYRAQPNLLYDGHPWLEFVRTGHAAYLGWEPDYRPPARPCDHRKLLADLRMGVGVALHPKVCTACGGHVLWP